MLIFRGFALGTGVGSQNFARSVEMHRGGIGTRASPDPPQSDMRLETQMRL